MKKINAKDITFIALLLALGIAVKAITDTFMRTALFFLMWDPLTIINTCIFIKYKEKKYLIILILIETVLAATLFMATDIYFLRPFDIAITYLVCRLFNQKNTKIKYFFSTYFSLLTNIIIVFLLFLIFPNIINADMTQVHALIDSLKDLSIWWKIFTGAFTFIVISIWISLPSVFNMLIGKRISDLTDKIIGRGK